MSHTGSKKQPKTRITQGKVMSHKASSGKDCRVNVRISKEEYERLTEIAQVTGVNNVSAVIRQAVSDLTKEKAVETALQGMEDRIAATLIRTLREVSRVREDSQLLIALIDQLVQFQFHVEPPIIDKEAAKITATTRYNFFIESLTKSMSPREKRAKLSKKIEAALVENENN